MTTAHAIALAAAALALNPNDAAAREAMARALARAGTPTNANTTTPQEEKNKAREALWELANPKGDADDRKRADLDAVCAAYVAAHSPDECAQMLERFARAIRNAKSGSLEAYLQRYAEQVMANEGGDDDRHQEQASQEARGFCDPLDADEVKSALDNIESANDMARWLFDLETYESEFGEIGPPKKRNRYDQPEGNELPQTFRNMLAACTERLDFDAISRRNAPDRSEIARMLWDRIESELTSSAEEATDRAEWIAAIVAAWPDLDDAEGAAEVIFDAIDDDEDDEEGDDDSGDYHRSSGSTDPDRERFGSD